jgi:hypothetical protein
MEDDPKTTLQSFLVFRRFFQGDSYVKLPGHRPELPGKEISF